MTDVSNDTRLLDQILEDARALWKAYRELHPQLPPDASSEQVSTAENCDGDEFARIQNLLTPSDTDVLRALATDERVWTEDSGFGASTVEQAVQYAVESLVAKAALDSSPTVNGKWEREGVPA